MALDLFGCYIAGKIKTFAGKEIGGQREFDLWTDSANGSALPSQLKALANLAYVSEVQIEVGMARNSRVSVTMTPPFEDALEIINSPLVQWGIGQLEVVIGYTTPLNGNNAALRTLTYGGLLQKPDVRIGSDITITLNALGVGYALDTANSVNGRQFPAGTSPAEAVETVLKDYTEFVLDDLWKDFGLSKSQSARNSGVKHPFFQAPQSVKVKDSNGNDVQTPVTIEVGPRNDWWFIQEECKNYGLDLYVVGKNVQIKDRNNWYVNQPNKGVKRFVVRGGMDPQSLLFPILDLSSPTTAVWLSAGIGEVLQQDVPADRKGPDSSGVNKVTIDDQSNPINQTGQGTVDKTQKAFGRTQNFGLHFPGNPETAAIEYARGEFKNQNYKKGINIEVETVGIPDLVPGEVITVLGTESASSNGRGVFNGDYGVVNVIHTIGIGGYSCHFKAIGNYLPEVMAMATAQKGQASNIDPSPSVGLLSNQVQGTRIKIDPIATGKTTLPGG
jgi:hypothetical protein